MLSRTLLSLASLGAANLALAQTTTLNITAEVCSDPTSFTTCTTHTLTSAKSCMDICGGSKICILGCGCAMYQNYINCVAESCWNQVYSCEYDELVAAYFVQCPVATEPIPYWPAPDNAPNGCSCNLGKVMQSAAKAQREYNSCITNSSTTSVMERGSRDTGCGCCQVSAGLSAMYETCPDTIPADMGADLWLTTSTLWGSAIKWDQCGTYLDKYSCPNLGFAGPASNSSIFYKPNSFPPNGTQTLYNTGVATAITAPPSGSVFTWSQSTVMFTVTASPLKNSNVKPTATGGSGSSGSSGGSGTSGTAGAAGSTKTGAATLLEQPTVIAWLSVLSVLAKMMFG